MENYVSYSAPQIYSLNPTIFCGNVKWFKTPTLRDRFFHFLFQICDLCQPVIQEVCQKLKPLTFTAEDTIPENQYENDPLSMGTTLFELYLALQRFTA